MKNIFAFIIFFGMVHAFAQKPMDSIFAGDVKMLTKFFPGSERGFSNSTYQMEPDAFLNKLDSFKSLGYASVDAGSDAVKELRKKDIDAFARMMLSTYRDGYGIDSVKSEQYYNVLSKFDNPDSSTQRMLDSLSMARFTKKLSDTESRRLDSLIFGGLGLNDSALFVSSAAYKRMVDM
nr:hypothetical protein [Chitinophagaceae bacterium]